MRIVVGLLFVAIGVTTRDTDAGRAALKLKVGQGICAAIRTLKSIHKHVIEKVGEAESKLHDVDNMVKLAKLKVLREKKAKSMECKKMTFFLKHMDESVAQMVSMLPNIRESGLNLTASAGIAAGRLEEMINVFQQPSGRQKFDILFCIGGKQGEVAAKDELSDCFSGGEDAIDSSHFMAFGDVEVTKGQKDVLKEGGGLEAVLKKYLALDDKDPRFTKGESRGCQLTRGGKGGGYIKDADLSDHLLWGDGLLGVRKDGAGKTGYVGKTRNKNYEHDIVWEENPTTNNPTLKKAVSDYNSFTGELNEFDAIYKTLTSDWSGEYIQENESAVALMEAEGLEYHDVVDLNSRTKQEWLSQKHAKEADKEFLMTEIRFCGKLKRRGFIRRMVRKILGGLRVSWTSEG